MLSLALPYPPSVNHYYGRRGNKTFIDRAGRIYRALVAMLCRAERVVKQVGLLAMFITVNPPDRRRRDVGNLDKCLLDALEHAGCFDDDSQVRAPVWMMEEPVKGGRVQVLICQHRTASQRLIALRDAIRRDGQ